jgi:hypothetical protein
MILKYACVSVHIVVNEILVNVAYMMQQQEEDNIYDSPNH